MSEINCQVCGSPFSMRICPACATNQTKGKMNKETMAGIKPNPETAKFFQWCKEQAKKTGEMTGVRDNDEWINQFGGIAVGKENTHKMLDAIKLDAYRAGRKEGMREAAEELKLAANGNDISVTVLADRWATRILTAADKLRGGR